jgi:hypothetical protein
MSKLHVNTLVKSKSGVLYNITDIGEFVNLVDLKMPYGSCYLAVPIQTFWLDFRPLTDDEKVDLL